MAKASSLTSMTVDALLKMRDDIGRVLSQKAEDLTRQLAALGRDTSSKGKRGPKPGSKSLKGKKVAPKYRGPNGELWAGRGARPIWLREALQGGASLESFSIGGGGAPAKKKAKKAGRKKRAAKA
ncbi:MAG: histone family protein [Xanthobacteraceae bacterium]|jgi:DNA-binding protein H-NS|nr:histone family protein [Xanthobacteraceae bacterium]